MTDQLKKLMEDALTGGGAIEHMDNGMTALHLDKLSPEDRAMAVKEKWEHDSNVVFEHAYAFDTHLSLYWAMHEMQTTDMMNILSFIFGGYLAKYSEQNDVALKAFLGSAIEQMTSGYGFYHAREAGGPDDLDVGVGDRAMEQFVQAMFFCLETAKQSIGEG